MSDDKVKQLAANMAAALMMVIRHENSVPMPVWNRTRVASDNTVPTLGFDYATNSIIYNDEWLVKTSGEEGGNDFLLAMFINEMQEFEKRLKAEEGSRENA